MVGWYLSLYEKTATKLAAVINGQIRLSDEEKAAMFIGYLAAYPKKENTNNNDGGNDNEQ